MQENMSLKNNYMYTLCPPSDLKKLHIFDHAHKHRHLGGDI